MTEREKDAIDEAFRILEEVGPRVTEKGPGVAMIVALELLVSLYLTDCHVVNSKTKEQSMEDLEDVFAFIRNQVDYMFNRCPPKAEETTMDFSSWKVKT